MYRGFDNSSQPLTIYKTCRETVRPGPARRVLRQLLGRSGPLLERGGSHCQLTLASDSFVYPVIRKNACTTFSRLIHATQTPGSDPTVRTFGQLRGADCRFFVFRNPVDRLLSTWHNNLVIDPDTSNSIAENFRDLSGCDPERATFEIFVDRYLGNHLRPVGHRWPVDLHLVPQADHLWPINYEFVLSMESLFADASVLFGKAIAVRFFRTPHNRTWTRKYGEPMATRPVAELRKLVRDTGKAPHKQDYLTRDLREQIRELYAVDFDLWERLNVASRLCNHRGAIARRRGILPASSS